MVPLIEPNSSVYFEAELSGAHWIYFRFGTQEANVAAQRWISLKKSQLSYEELYSCVKRLVRMDVKVGCHSVLGTT